MDTTKEKNALFWMKAINETTLTKTFEEKCKVTSDDIGMDPS